MLTTVSCSKLRPAITMHSVPVNTRTYVSMCLRQLVHLYCLVIVPFIVSVWPAVGHSPSHLPDTWFPSYHHFLEFFFQMVLFLVFLILFVYLFFVFLDSLVFTLDCVLANPDFGFPFCALFAPSERPLLWTWITNLPVPVLLNFFACYWILQFPHHHTHAFRKITHRHLWVFLLVIFRIFVMPGKLRRTRGQTQANSTNTREG